MVLDTSAILAILFNEPERVSFVRKIADAETVFVSAATLLEAAAVLTRRTAERDDRYLQRFLAENVLSIVPFDAEQSEIARAAYRHFGRGSGHPARLNFGDCFAYALAKHLGVPLLFKSTDFAHTDIAVA
jgi:ribonuclease VapC